MTVPFMRAYALLLLKTCHKRNAPAIGGMSALIPIKNDPEANDKAMAGIRGDKKRDATDGYDGGWVAHPGLVGPAMEEFVAVLGERANQIDKKRDDVNIAAANLLDFQPEQPITEAGLRNNISVGIQYLGSWLARQRLRADLQPDGRRRHGGDLALAGVAVDTLAQGQAGGRPQGHQGAGARVDPAGDGRRSRAWSATPPTTPPTYRRRRSSRRCPPRRRSPSS